MPTRPMPTSPARPRLPLADSLLVALCLALAATSASSQTVEILSPADGATVAGSVDITGTADGIGVAVSVDGGPFEPASGLSSWTFSWSTASSGNGPVTLTARTRACVGCSPVFDSISVTVENDGPSVDILFPEDGATVFETLVMIGTSSGASTVEVSVDGGPPQIANGLAPWTVVFEPGALEAGERTLTARARADDGQTAEDAVVITVGESGAGLQTFSYLSSVDAVPMTGVYYVPETVDLDGGPRALVVHLHGGGGTGVISDAMQQGLDAKGWIGISPDGREWGLHDPDDPESCSWRTSAAYVDSPDPRVGPGEQDIFDAIGWAEQTFDVDPDRIYLQGFSMGGRGTYAIGLKNPDRFAGIAPLGPAIDMFEIFVRRPEPAACKEGMVGGQPGDSLLVDTNYAITSGRFLIENAYNLPVFHGHGTLDNVSSNFVANAPFLHGWHLTSDTGWSDCHGDSQLCFGHTPTLSELQARHGADPQAYPWAFFFSAVGHVTDPRWLTGGAMETGDFGVENPEAPGEWLGIYDFFESHPKATSPETVVYKSYTDTHRSAYWLDLLINTPWQHRPGAVRATRDTALNALRLELVRTEEIAVDLAQAQLQLGSGATLAVTLQPLVEPTYDPGLLTDGEELTPVLVLRGDFTGLGTVEALLDGVDIAPSLVAQTPDSLRIGPLPLAGFTSLALSFSDGLFTDSFESGGADAWSATVSGGGATRRNVSNPGE